MKEMILRVVKCGECFTVKSEKSEGGVLNKRTLVLQELGGKYEETGNAGWTDDHRHVRERTTHGRLRMLRGCGDGGLHSQMQGAADQSGK